MDMQTISKFAIKIWTPHSKYYITVQCRYVSSWQCQPAMRDPITFLRLAGNTDKYHDRAILNLPVNVALPPKEKLFEFLIKNTAKWKNVYIRKLRYPQSV